MKHVVAFSTVLCGLLVFGCSNREKEQALQTQIAQVERDRSSVQQVLSERDQYLEEVVQAVNQIYADLEKARVKEGQIVKRAEGSDSPMAAKTLDTRQNLLRNISEIGTSLKENRKKIGELQARIKSYHGEIASLAELVDKLKASLEEREQSIAQLQVRVQGLEATVIEKTKLIQEKDTLLERQRRKINTVFYVVGTRDELKKKGIITDEGGFLWGLLGSTTIMAGGIDPSSFSPLDRTKDSTLHFQGKIDEILPRRSDDFFAEASIGENDTELRILQPEQFWQNNYLVVVLD
jgi:hypothetical protein